MKMTKRLRLVLIPAVFLLVLCSNTASEEDVRDYEFWIDKAVWLRNGGNFLSATRCAQTAARLSNGRTRKQQDHQLTVSVLWNIGDHTRLVELVGCLLICASQHSGKTKSSWQVVVFAVEDAPRSLLRELTIWRGVRVVSLGHQAPILKAPHRSLAQSLQLLRTSIRMHGPSLIAWGRFSRCDTTCIHSLSEIVSQVQEKGYFLSSTIYSSMLSEVLLGARDMHAVDTMMVPELMRGGEGRHNEHSFLAPVPDTEQDFSQLLERNAETQKKAEGSDLDEVVHIMIWPLESHYRLPSSPLKTCDVPCFFLPPAPQLLPKAHAVLIHVPSLNQSQPLLPPRRFSHQKWVLFSQESASNFPLQATPSFLDLFSASMTYELNSTVPVTYFDRPLLSGWTYHTLPAPQKDPSKQVVSIIGKCHSHTRRSEILEELGTLVELHSYGQCARNRHPPYPPEKWNNMYGEAKLQVMSEYHFCVALENSAHADYVTEKALQALAAGCVPIYLGARNVRDFLPTASYVDVRDFASIQDLARHLRWLMAHRDAYDAMLAWKQNATELARLDKMLQLASHTGWCRLCHAVRP